MLRIEIVANNRVCHGGFEGKELSDLGRKLVAAGYEDQPFEVYRKEVKCLQGRSLVGIAGRIVKEEPHLRYVKYRSFKTFT